MVQPMFQINRGDVVWVNLRSVWGSNVQSGNHPCVVVSCNKGNHSSKTFNIIPGTSKLEKNYFPTHIELNRDDFHGKLDKRTVFLGEQVHTVGIGQILWKVGHITDDSETMRKINEILVRQLELG